MRGVDVFDYLKGVYNNEHSSWKWWKSIFMFLLEASIINSYKLYCCKISKQMSHKDFRIEIVKTLINDFDENSKARNCKLIKSDQKRDCSICSDRNIKRVQTRYKCEVCNKFTCPECYDTHRKFSIIY
jgi:hypothetical protein